MILSHCQATNLFTLCILIKVTIFNIKITNLDTEESTAIGNLLARGNLKPTNKPSSLGLHNMLLQKRETVK